jgi:hypothetical protein
MARLPPRSESISSCHAVWASNHTYVPQFCTRTMARNASGMFVERPCGGRFESARESARTSPSLTVGSLSIRREEFAPTAGAWIGPIGGFLATLAFAFWAARRAGERPICHGAALGVLSVLVSFFPSIRLA